MISITERKIAGLSARWARFPGFSLLFDPPGEVFQLADGVETLACDVEGDPGLELYRRLAHGFSALSPDRLMAAYGLCALPTPSYHVTAHDVANVADLPRCHADIRDGLRTTLDRLPEPGAFDDDLLDRAKEFARAEWNLTFRYGSLYLGSVMLVHLEPVDSQAFDRFVAARTALSRAYREAYGVGAGERYGPHVSLGYFMNEAGAEAARARQTEWDAKLREAAGDAPVTFRTLSLYGFTDMATFFRRSAQG